MSKRTQYEQPVELKEAEPRFVYWQRNWRINTERAHRPGAATRLHQAEAAHAGSYSDRQARISRQRGAEVRIWEAWGDPPDPAGLGFRRRSPTDAIRSRVREESVHRGPLLVGNRKFEVPKSVPKSMQVAVL